MKERHWTSLVTSLRHGRCVLFVGQEIPGTPSIEPSARALVKGDTCAEGLTLQLAEEARRGRPGSPCSGNAGCGRTTIRRRTGLRPQCASSSGAGVLPIASILALACAPSACCAAIQSHRYNLSRRAVVTRAQRERQVSPPPSVQLARRQAREPGVYLTRIASNTRSLPPFRQCRWSRARSVLSENDFSTFSHCDRL